MRFAFRRCVALVVLLAAVPVVAGYAQSRSPFEGMWSNPPATPEGQACVSFCSDAGLARLNVLLDDPANDSRPYSVLRVEAEKYQQDSYIVPRLTELALKTFPLAPAADPGFLHCEPWGVARQMFAQHQLEIRQRGPNVIEMRYGEWDAKRTIHLGEPKASARLPPTPMGYSVGHYEGNALVIQTTRVTPNWTRFLSQHSDQLKIVERYTRSQDGKILYLAATMEDPSTLREPVVLKKMWSWSPKSEIAPYKDCQLPTGLVSQGR
jgi:hypothetical protein